jgi:iron complex outermembrane receptor protein
MFKTILLATASAAILPVSPALAQQASQPAVAATNSPAGGGDVDGDAPAKAADRDQGQAIVVTGTRRPTADVLGGVSVLDADEMAHDLKPSLGDTLADMPGVSASSFGPSSSRPILRGLSGEDASILIDGLTSLDLSASDPDHAVAINPLTAERIEVLRGPGALLYDSSAIGGVVNVIDNRIPRAVPARLDADLLLNYGTAANERSGNLSVNVPIGGHFVAHADGAYSKYDDLHVGGYLLTDPLRREALASPDPAIRALASLRNMLLNTAGRVNDLAGGLAYVDGELNVGVSYNHHDARYGVPIRFSLDPNVQPEEPTIDAHQDRADVRANVPIGGFLRLFEMRAGISKYHHDELTPDGSVGSSFYSNGGEVRADVVQTERGGWGGTTGVQYLSQTARIRGEEKYLPDSRKEETGLFTLQTYENGPLRLEGAFRIESAKLTADADAQIGNGALDRSFTPISASVGGKYEFLRDWRIGLALSHSERAPSIEELFSLGPHGGSQQFLIGNPDLTKQASNGVELSLRRTSGGVRFEGSIYYNRYSNFIYQAPTGEIRDGLPVYLFGEGRANYYGFDFDTDVHLGQVFGIDWGSEVTADAVRAKIRNFGNAPEIPPLRVLGGLYGTRGKVTGRVEVEHVWDQTDIAPEETPTPGYTMVNASIDWHPIDKNPDLTLSLTGNNLFDVNARRHASDLKDFAPLAGRDIRLTARMNF